MLNPRKLRRNDVVIKRDNSGFEFYGRVWKRFDDHHVWVIDCGKHVRVYHEDDLALSDYIGNYKWQHHPDNHYGNPVRWRHMTGLRKLKIMARKYSGFFGGKKWPKQDRPTATLIRLYHRDKPTKVFINMR